MSTTALQAGMSARETIAERCRRMGLPTLLLSAGGEASPLDAGSGIERALLLSPMARRALALLGQAWAAEDPPTPREIWPGLTAIALPERQRRKVTGWVVAVSITPEARDAEQFDAACRSAEVDAAAARAHFGRAAPLQQIDLHAAMRLLHWMWDDLLAVAVAREEVDQFSRQMTETYEELSLLYRIGRSMHEIEQPDRFVRTVCEELLATLPFRWVAAAFMRNSPAAGAMERRVFVACEDAAADEIGPIAEWTLDGLTPGEASVISGLEARVAGAPDGAEMVVHPVERKGEIIGAVVAGQKRGDDPHVTSVDSKLVAAAASNLSVFLENAALYDEQRAMFLGTLRALTASIDAKDRYTRGHSERVAHLTRQLARATGVDHQTADRFHITGLVHDVGKIGVPEAVLRKAGRLTDEEFAHIRRHPEIGYTILRDIPQFADILPGVLHHHERWDGRGYPSGLRAEEIPLVARLIALADSFDAMSSTRTYRPAMQRERVLDEIRRGAAAQFDPALASVFLTLDLSEFDAMVARHESGERAAPDAAAPIALPAPDAPPPTAEAA